MPELENVSTRQNRATLRALVASLTVALTASLACSPPAAVGAGGAGTIDTAGTGALAGSGGSGGPVPGLGTGGSAGGLGTGGTSPTTGGATNGTAGVMGTGGAAAVSFITTNGRLPAGNAFGLQGDWYAFADGITSTASGNPYRDGMYCITGQALGDGNADNWGAGVGVDLNSMGGQKMSFAYEGVVTGFRMKLVGTVPAPPRVQFTTNAASDGVAPFIIGTLDESVVYSIADAVVPLDWGVDNAGERVEANLFSLQILVPGSDVAGPIDLCVAEFEPIYDPNGGTPTVTGPYINSDGFILPDQNTLGIQGPVYAIGDGVSTTQVGNPFQDGKYCVAGTFTGAAEDWGAGIAFDLSRAPGGTKLPYTHDGVIEGFRIGLSGTSPGPVRVQFVLDEPQAGNQPFLVGRLNASFDYLIDWAEVPTSWDVDDAGRDVGASIYTLQIYLDGSVAGPFEVCVDAFEPLTAAQLTRDAQPAGAGYTGARTIEDASLSAEYQNWKTRHLQDCGNGTACVPRDEGDCISEGVAYGMLLTVGNDDQAAFDQLWAYFDMHKNANGVMKWQTDACGDATAEGSATDGELDAAMALIQAGCRWGGTYEAEALELIAAIQATEVTTCDGLMVLKPGDNFGGCDRTNPSYVAPGYFKVFAALTGDASWTTLANDGYTLLTTLQAAKSGLVPDWSDGSGAPASGTEGDYGPDASRTPWRVATDYVWFNEPQAVTFLNSVSTYVDGNGGVARQIAPNSAFRGGLAMSALPALSTKAQMYTDAWLSTSVDDDTYFPGTLRPIYMMLMAHQFPKGCD